MNGRMDECVKREGGMDVWMGGCEYGLGEWNDGRSEGTKNG